MNLIKLIGKSENDLIEEAGQRYKDEQTFENALKGFKNAFDKVIDSTIKRNQAIKELTQLSIGKFVRDINYYEKHGSPTLPKNNRIDMTTNFNK